MNSEGTKDLLSPTEARYRGCQLLLENASERTVKLFNRFWNEVIGDRNEKIGLPRNPTASDFI